MRIQTVQLPAQLGPFIVSYFMLISERDAFVRSGKRELDAIELSVALFEFLQQFGPRFVAGEFGVAVSNLFLGDLIDRVDSQHTNMCAQPPAGLDGRLLPFSESKLDLPAFNSFEVFICEQQEISLFDRTYG